MAVTKKNIKPKGPAPRASANSKKKLSFSLKNVNLKNKWFLLSIVVAFAAIGFVFTLLTGAAPNNCQVESGVNICDVDQVAGGSDTVLSVDAEAQVLGSQGWGAYYGVSFRAPTYPLNGAVPIHRVYNSNATYHDWVTDAQKAAKEASYGAASYEGVPFFAWPDARQPGTVPVYKMTRGGPFTQALFTTDKSWVDRTIAADSGNPDGWKIDQFGPAVAFYAYPPNYQVAAAPNPYDCTILENFLSDRCTMQRENLEKAANEGRIPETNECPKTLNDYNKAAFPSQFNQDCQNFWNTYMKDCSISENFTSDRCKKEREALAKAQAEQERLRAEAAAAAKKALGAPKGTGGTGGNGGGGSGTTDPPAGSKEPNVDPVALGNSFADGSVGGGAAAPKGTCTITWKMDKFWGAIGSSNGRTVHKNITQGECLNKLIAAKNKTIDGMNRRHYDYKYTWKAN